MGYSISIVHKNGEYATIKPTFLSGSNIHVNANLEQIPAEDAEMSLTYNYSKYYYEATEGDEYYEGKGLRAIGGKPLDVGVDMLKELMSRIYGNYCMGPKHWCWSKRKKTTYLDAETVREIAPLSYVQLSNEEPWLFIKRTDEYWVNEGDTSNYWEVTAANAIAGIDNLLKMADNLSEEEKAQDLTWEID